MRLLFILPEYPPHFGGGIVTFYRDLLPEFVRLGHKVHVIVGSAFTSKYPSYELEGVTVEFLDSERVTENLSLFKQHDALPELQRHLSAAWTAWRQAEYGDGYDLVETTDWGLLSVPWALSSDGPPVVVQLHGSVGQIDYYEPRASTALLGNMVRLIEAEVLSLADALHAHGKTNLKEWRKATRRQVEYIPPPLNMADSDAPAGKRSGAGVVIGRVQYWKGPTVLCEALRRLGAEAPTIGWVGRDSVYGKTGLSMSAYLDEHYPDVWRRKILPSPQVPPHEARRLQVKSSFVIVPSIWDVFNYTAAEAMIAGAVVICSSGAGASDLIEDGVNGYTFRVGDAEGLAEKIRTCWDLSEAQRERIARAGRETVQASLDSKKVAERKVAAYERLLNSREAKRAAPWLSSVCTPNETTNGDLAFLDNQPLSKLTSYCLRRTFRKLIS